MRLFPPTFSNNYADKHDVNRYVFVCLALSIISATLFVADTNGVFDKAHNPIAVVKESVRTVRRLPNNELTWERAREGTQLELGDTISTGDRAQAKIVFNAGGVMTLEAGSMVVLSGSSEELKLNFVAGGAHLEVAKEAKEKIKVVQPLAKRIRSAVEVTWLEDKNLLTMISKKAQHPKKTLTSEILPEYRKPELKPPELSDPVTNFHFPFSPNSVTTVKLSWQPVKEAKGYRVYVESDSANVILDEEVQKQTSIAVPDLGPGTYKWSVYSIGEESTSNSSPTFTFTVDDVPHLEWSDNKVSENFSYVTEQPTLNSKWRLRGGGASATGTYFKISAREDQGGPTLITTTRGFSADQNLSHDGLYHIQVEYLSDDGHSLSLSPVRDVVVSRKPLLPAPQFDSRLPASLTAARNGSVGLYWKDVAGAQGYAIQVRDTQGKTVKTVGSKNSSSTLRGLLPGDYKISVASVDSFERTGPFGEEKTVHVPDISDLRGPAFKRFEVK
jgi:hypothetical protein